MNEDDKFLSEIRAAEYVADRYLSTVAEAPREAEDFRAGFDEGLREAAKLVRITAPSFGPLADIIDSVVSV